MTDTYKCKCFECGALFDGSVSYKEHLVKAHGAPEKFVELVLYVDMEDCVVHWWVRDAHVGFGTYEAFIDGHDGGEPPIRYARYLDMDRDTPCVEVTAVFPEWGVSRKARAAEYMARHLEPTQEAMRAYAAKELNEYLEGLNKLPKTLQDSVPDVMFDPASGKLEEKEDTDE